MDELIGGGILGSLLGGAFRLVPEVLKWSDKKNERKHELAMFEEQCKLEAQKGAQKMAEIGAAHNATLDSSALDALKLSITQQTEMVKAAGGWAAALSATVRPVMTYYMLLMYGVVKFCLAYTQIAAGAPFVDVMPRLWDINDITLLSGVVNYWILDRTLAKRGL